jgi:hypothetical protein
MTHSIPRPSPGKAFRVSTGRKGLDSRYPEVLHTYLGGANDTRLHTPLPVCGGFDLSWHWVELDAFHVCAPIGWVFNQILPTMLPP